MNKFIPKKENTKVKASFRNREEALSELSDLLYTNGYVKEEYKARILEREKNYPTGLEVGEINVAIPHTDAELVKRSTVGICTLKEPISFYKMDDPDREVGVKIIFMLAMSEPDQQIDLLKAIFTKIKDKEFLERIDHAKDREELLELFEKEIVK